MFSKNMSVTYELGQFEQVPSASGIYAWYYRPKISEKSLKDLESELQNISLADRKIRISAFLQREIFEFLREEDYVATMDGGLRPNYVGRLKFESPLSESLCVKIAQNPSQLWSIRSVLENLQFYFTPPIYVGMAKNLRDRLKRHKYHIDNIDFTKTDGAVAGFLDDIEQSEQYSLTFALDVSRRNLSLDRLCVAVHVIDVGDNSHNSVENILNRIAHPLCGRR